MTPTQIDANGRIVPKSQSKRKKIPSASSPASPSSPTFHNNNKVK